MSAREEATPSPNALRAILFVIGVMAALATAAFVGFYAHLLVRAFALGWGLL